MADSPTVSPKPKRKKEEKLSNTVVDRFLEWCHNVDLSLNEKVTVQEDGCRHRFGMIAVEKLNEGECVFKIPRNILLEPSTSSISKILAELNYDSAENSTRHRWLPLLVTLLYEYTNPSSKWRPYLDLVPNEDVLNQPIFWNEQEREYLDLIGMKHNVTSDIKCIEEQYHDYVLAFMRRNPEYFDPKIHTLELYKRLSGFVMAYSFTDYGPNEETAQPAMVPMADILNHISDNNAHLEFGEEYLCMVTTQAIEKGGEVFNTYGDLDNCNLLRSYGFIEDCPNPYDDVEIPFEVFQEVLNMTDDIWQIKLSRIQEQLTDVFDGKGLLFDRNGCLCSEDGLFGLFQIIHEEAPGTEADEENSITRINGQVENFIRTDYNTAKDIGDSRLQNEKHFEDFIEVGILKSDQELLSYPEKRLERETDKEEEIGDKNSEEVDSDGGKEDNDVQEWDSDSSIDEDVVDDLQPFDELICLPVEWRQTLNRAAKTCSQKIMDYPKKFSATLNGGQDTRRKAMVQSISQGRLWILKQIEDLYQP